MSAKGRCPSFSATERLLFQKLQNFGGVRFGVGNWNPVPLDRAVGANQCGGTDRTFDGLALRVFPRPPRTVGFHHLDTWIR
jgi:hypothetical protein